MKNIRLFIICIFVVTFLNSCDFYSKADITIKNESSYNLKINIKYKELPRDHYDGEENINIKMGESATFRLGRIGGVGVEPRNPNNDIISITFFDIDTNNVIKELNTNDLFNLINQNKYNADYLFIISDDLLH